MKPILHGENYLDPISELPKLKKNAKREIGKSVIVGHSETGHHHVVECEADLEYIIDGIERYLVVTAPAKIKHQKQHDIHETLDVAPGLYRVTSKQEYNPWEKVMQRVFD